MTARIISKWKRHTLVPQNSAICGVAPWPFSARVRFQSFFFQIKPSKLPSKFHMKLRIFD